MERVIARFVSEDPPMPIRPATCGGCGIRLPVCPMYRIGHCKCGARDWDVDWDTEWVLE